MTGLLCVLRHGWKLGYTNNNTHGRCLSELTTEVEIKQPLHGHLSTVVLNATEEKYRVSEHLERADLA